MKNAETIIIELIMLDEEVYERFTMMGFQIASREETMEELGQEFLKAHQDQMIAKLTEGDVDWGYIALVIIQMIGRKKTAKENSL